MIATLRFVGVAAASELAPGAMLSVTAGGQAIALANVGGKVFAIGDLCLRCGAPLAHGVLRGTVVSCSGCDWKYELTDGRVVGLPTLQVRTFEVRLDDGRLAVGLHEHHDAHGHRPA